MSIIFCDGGREGSLQVGELGWPSVFWFIRGEVECCISRTRRATAVLTPDSSSPGGPARAGGPDGGTSGAWRTVDRGDRMDPPRPYSLFLDEHGQGERVTPQGHGLQGGPARPAPSPIDWPWPT
jgi:hypothetical protein